MADLNLEDKFEWWGYLHTTGTIQAKRYFGPLDINEAKESPFCVKVVGPFMAKGRMDALEKVSELIKE
jgi:hypothetical protein